MAWVKEKIEKKDNLNRLHQLKSIFIKSVAFCYEPRAFFSLGRTFAHSIGRIFIFLGRTISFLPGAQY